MKRISLILASLALVFSTKASAASGGPFDNGDYSSLLDNAGVYQVALRFSNGSGFAQFGNNVDVALFVDTNSGALAGGAQRSSTYSVLNRSIIYYKGVSYLGNCYGMVDHERKIVHGVTNGNSDVGSTAVTTAGGTAGGTNSGTRVTAASTTLYNNGGQGLAANCEFRCKITNTYPILRFVGEGELSVLNPSIGQIVLAGIQGIITAAVNADTSGNTTPINIGTQINSLLTAVDDNDALLGQVLPTAASIDENADRVKVHAFGSRVFFVNRR